jgi:hypothetical protein
MSGGEPERVTADDVVALNRGAIGRGATAVRRAAMLLIAIGVVALAALLWLNVREQQRLSDRGFTGVGDVEEPDFIDRVDLFANGFIWELPVLAIAVGFGLRLFADYTVTRTGGSLAGVDTGDPVPGDETPGNPRVIIRPE